MGTAPTLEVDEVATMTFLNSVLFPLLTAAVTSGLIISLLTLRSQRRQINAGAKKDEATAADLLTGKALAMVDHAQAEAAAARAEAIAARQEATAARKRAEEAEEHAAESARLSLDCATEVMRLTGVVRTYETFILAHGLDIPA